MLIIAGLAAPIYAATEGWKVGCLPQLVPVWGVLVAVPLVLMVIIGSMAASETAKEKWSSLFGALAIVGYFLACLATACIIGVSRPWLL
jgi:FtsH-binding integral membrane protein